MKKMARPAGGNVLAELDKRRATAFYWRLTLLSTIGGFLFGYDTSNIGAALNFIPYPLNGFAQGYLVAGAVAIVFVLRFLPETKGHSVEEIIRLFEREARGGTGTGPGGAPAGERAPA